MEYRLNRYLSSSGFCSRREADKYIEDGHVTIDGRKAHIGQRVLPSQIVKISGEVITNEVDPVYIAFNKPVGVVCTTDSNDPENIVDFIQHEQRIFPIGRLDKDSQGLILLTNDGDIVNKILRAGNKNPKEYIVTVDRTITPEFLKGMAGGVPILDRVTRKCDLKQINPTTFKITLTQGLNRQIRRMCEHFSFNVVKLERIQVMNIHLEKLGQGNWRDLTLAELNKLFDLLDDAENEVPKSKNQSPSSVKYQAEKSEKNKLKKEKVKVKKKDDEDEIASPRSKKGNPRAKRSSTGSGLRLGKQRTDKIARKTKTREKNKARRNKK